MICVVSDLSLRSAARGTSPQRRALGRPLALPKGEKQESIHKLLLLIYHTWPSQSKAIPSMTSRGSNFALGIGSASHSSTDDATVSPNSSTDIAPMTSALQHAIIEPVQLM